MAGNTKKQVLFDFDGVIADTFALSFAVRRMMCPQISEREYRRAFEGNIYEWAEDTFQHSDTCRHDIDFFEEYVPRFKETVKLFPGMIEVIRDLSERFALSIISSTISSPIREYMGAHDAVAHFVRIMGSDVHRSKVEKINMVLAETGAAKEECVFITDTLGDMLEAQKSGVGSIGVSWGFQKHETLARGKPFRVVEKPSELPPAIAEYFAGERR